jgi:5-methylcytosine-specific restriction protein A
VAEIESHACQICNWSLEWINSKRKKVYRIDVDHIVDKAKNGGEALTNLWALCPNCHAEKTMGVITIDFQKKRVYRQGEEIKLHHDRHLFI